MARNMELSFWNEPSSVCLFSIIPYRERIAIENMKMVGLAGYFLKCRGFGQLRERAHGKLARIELLDNDL